MKHVFFIIAALLPCVACTPGSFGLATSSTAGAAGVTGKVLAVDVDLTKDVDGYLPVDATIDVGDGVRFHNSDGFDHTATSITGATFPSAYPFTNAALVQTSATLSEGFSSGNLTAGSFSQTLLADKPGTFLFGCFYHYGSPMRAEIDVR
jgi:plastocyanin